MSYRISTETRGDRTIHHLHDDATGASASVLPSYGFNLFDLRLPAGGQVRSLISTQLGWADNPSSPGGNGFPVLFPFPNRIRDARYSFEGKDYQLEANLGPNAIHGYALDAPWEVVQHKANDDGASITGRYRLFDQSPQARDLWPTDAILELTYRLSGRTLTLDISVSNPTAEVLPYGLGFHPYFHLPFEPGADLSKARLVVPASELWVLEEFLPTGERRPVDDRLDFRQGQSMADLKLDDVLTGLNHDDDGRCVCRLIDENLGAELQFAFDRNFREIVLYTPPNRPGVISVEPYTQTTDAINLHAQGIDAGLRLLQHGERDTMRISLETVG